MASRLEQIRARYAHPHGAEAIANGHIDAAWLLSEVDRLTAEAEEDRRALIEQPVLRHCVYPGCLREFDASAALSGRPTRESWSGKGWFQVRVLNSHICPDHAHVVAEDAHRPQWRHGDGPSVLVCACSWESVPVRWRGYGIEAWKDHVLTINEETPS